jgi:hypothetical protein
MSVNISPLPSSFGGGGKDLGAGAGCCGGAAAGWIDGCGIIGGMDTIGAGCGACMGCCTGCMGIGGTVLANANAGLTTWSVCENVIVSKSYFARYALDKRPGFFFGLGISLFKVWACFWLAIEPNYHVHFDPIAGPPDILWFWKAVSIGIVQPAPKRHI